MVERYFKGVQQHINIEEIKAGVALGVVGNTLTKSIYGDNVVLQLSYREGGKKYVKRRPIKP